MISENHNPSICFLQELLKAIILHGNFSHLNKAMASKDIFSFPPISDSKSTILILGTMPGAKSLEMNQYYAHPRNVFWKILFRMFDTTPSDNYSDCVELLLTNRIALWDVLRSCDRKGSADSAIDKESPNQISEFLENHKSIRYIFFNGSMAAHYFQKYFSTSHSLSTFTLPSTSPANAQKTFDQKYYEWHVIRDVLLQT